MHEKFRNFPGDSQWEHVSPDLLVPSEPQEIKLTGLYLPLSFYTVLSLPPGGTHANVTM